MHIRSVLAGSTLAVLLAVNAIGVAAADPGQFSPAEQHLIGLLPPGYHASACTPATNGFANAIASLDCTDDRNTDTPDYARFTLYNNLDALTADFYAIVEGMSVSPCPGGPNGGASPGSWNYGPNLSIPGGKIVCGNIEDQSDIAWTRDGQLLLATVNGGPSMDDLYQWWQSYGAATGQ